MTLSQETCLFAGIVYLREIGRVLMLKPPVLYRPGL